MYKFNRLDLYARWYGGYFKKFLQKSNCSKELNSSVKMEAMFANFLFETEIFCLFF